MKPGYPFVCVRDAVGSPAFCERAFGLPRRFLHESGGRVERRTEARG